VESLKVGSGDLWNNDGEDELTHTALPSFGVFGVQANHRRGVVGHRNVPVEAAA
jgi:hypothetical protein